MLKIKIFYKGNPEQTEEEFNRWMEAEPPKEIVTFTTATAVAPLPDPKLGIMRQVNTFTLTVLYREMETVK